MDLDQLHTFLEIVRLKSFSKAAQTCFRTQPAISAQVRQLEQELNAPLFDRLGTKISLTVAGKIFAEYAAQILDLRRQAQDAINELERTPRGELIIAANEATCIYVLPKVFPEFKRQYPNVQLMVDRSYGSSIVHAVTNNLADFGITQLPFGRNYAACPAKSRFGRQEIRASCRSGELSTTFAEVGHNPAEVEFLVGTG